jgi:hypothetical protein
MAAVWPQNVNFELRSTARPSTVVQHEHLVRAGRSGRGATMARDSLAEQVQLKEAEIRST